MQFRCYVCNGLASWYGRCEEHYTCDECGAKKDLLVWDDGIFCKECHKKRVASAIAHFDGDTGFTDEITCPWCGKEQSDSWEAPDEYQHVCEFCGKKYKHEREVETSCWYSTSKIEYPMRGWHSVSSNAALPPAKKSEGDILAPFVP